MASWLTFLLGSLCVFTVKAEVMAESRVRITTPPIKIAAFNIQVFGTQKLSNKKVFDTLVKIVLRYDLILIQEIRDNSNTGIKMLMEKVNQKAMETLKTTYKYVISPRLGRTTSKEQYAFIYRPDRLNITSKYVFDDGDEATGEDLFQREPYLVKVNSPTSAVTNFGLIGIHTQPDKAIEEINNLVKVYENMKLKWRISNAIILGDFNADCGYVPKKAWAHMPIFTDSSQFTWLFGNNVDTTTGPSNCAYDRMVVAGSKMKEAVIPDTAQIFRFDLEYKLTEEEAQAVSDHYPIEVQIKGKSGQRRRKNLKDLNTV